MNEKLKCSNCKGKLYIMQGEGNKIAIRCHKCNHLMINFNIKEQEASENVE